MVEITFQTVSSNFKVFSAIDTPMFFMITELPKFVQMLWFIGFGPTGVLAGSFAASWQSSIGNVVAGSLFSGVYQFIIQYVIILKWIFVNIRNFLQF